MAQAVISLYDVRRYFLMGEFVVKALDGVTLSIEEGEFTAITGPLYSSNSTFWERSTRWRTS